MFGSDSLETRLKQFLTPSGFFAGVVFGFVACCVLGRQLPKWLPMRDFQRLHAYLNPQTQYYPTALQIRALARSELPRDKIAVVISGNSILMGWGQSTDEIWTKRLQRELGDEFRLLNLAAPSGAPNEYGQAAIEMICADHPRVLHVCNCSALAYARGADGSSRTYRYFHRDARARGLLLRFDERERALAALESQRAAEPAWDESQLQVWANRWLSFNDFWHVVGYEACFTVWTMPSGLRAWRARHRWPDGSVISRQQAILNWPKQRQELQLHAAAYTNADWERYAAVVKQSVPELLRPKTLAVIVRRNPMYLAKLEEEWPGSLAQYDGKIRTAINVLQSCGLAATQAGVDMAPEDFADSLHLLASGGAKLADDLAPVIRDLARQLGYVKGD